MQLNNLGPIRESILPIRYQKNRKHPEDDTAERLGQHVMGTKVQSPSPTTGFLKTFQWNRFKNGLAPYCDRLCLLRLSRACKLFHNYVHGSGAPEVWQAISRRDGKELGLDRNKITSLRKYKPYLIKVPCGVFTKSVKSELFSICLAPYCNSGTLFRVSAVNTTFHNYVSGQKSSEFWKRIALQHVPYSLLPGSRKFFSHFDYIIESRVNNLIYRQMNSGQLFPEHRFLFDYCAFDSKKRIVIVDVEGIVTLAGLSIDTLPQLGSGEGDSVNFDRLYILLDNDQLVRLSRLETETIVWRIDQYDLEKRCIIKIFNIHLLGAVYSVKKKSNTELIIETDFNRQYLINLELEKSWLLEESKPRFVMGLLSGEIEIDQVQRQYRFVKQGVSLPIYLDHDSIPSGDALLLRSDCAAVSPKQDLFAVPTARGVIVWSLATGKVVRSVVCGDVNDYCLDICFLSQGLLIMSFDSYGIFCFNLNNGELQQLQVKKFLANVLWNNHIVVFWGPERSGLQLNWYLPQGFWKLSKLEQVKLVMGKSAE